MRRLLIAVGVLGVLAFPATASARPCSDFHPVVIDGFQWIVYTGDGPWELENLSCAKARRIARRAIRGYKVTGWKCSRKRHRCVRGGTYVDAYGHRQWRYLVGWHGAD